MAGHALHFHCAHWLATKVLAHTSDSLVRVSRRVGCRRAHQLETLAAENCRRRRSQTHSRIDRKELELTQETEVHQAVKTTRPCGPLNATSSAESDPRYATGNRVSSCQFQALFNSLFKVLCIFPSRYLFAIGLSTIFSFRWNLPPASGCTPKQPDSSRTHHAERERRSTGFSPSPIPHSKGFVRRHAPKAPLQTTILMERYCPSD